MGYRGLSQLTLGSASGRAKIKIYQALIEELSVTDGRLFSGINNICD
jgi:hypothetical protein